MSASCSAVRGNSNLVAEMIDTLVADLEAMIVSKGLPGGVPPASLLAQGLVVNRVMQSALQEHGPRGVLLLTEMYRDYCDMAIAENGSVCAQ
ncbi:hypothetical protein HW537_10840 [Asaia siamensis]